VGFLERKLCYYCLRLAGGLEHHRDLETVESLGGLRRDRSGKETKFTSRVFNSACVVSISYSVISYPYTN
jgi:hypothetical protein